MSSGGSTGVDHSKVKGSITAAPAAASTILNMAPGPPQEASRYH